MIAVDAAETCKYTMKSVVIALKVVLQADLFEVVCKLIYSILQKSDKIGLYWF